MEKMQKKLTTRPIPRKSPIQVLRAPRVAWLARSDGLAHFQLGMVVSDGAREKNAQEEWERTPFKRERHKLPNSLW